MTRWGQRLSPIPEVEAGAMQDLLLAHFYLGARVQRLLRLSLVMFFVATLLVVPPARGLWFSWAIVACYAIWAMVIRYLISQATARAAPFVWLTLLFDVLAAASLTRVADTSAAQTWTAFVIVNGFFVLPLLAAAQLNPWVCGLVSGLAVLTYLASSIATHHDEAEPWSLLLLRSGLLAVLGLGSVLLSLLQRHRVTEITRLAVDRARLVDELVEVEERERESLAEQLHDGALQYVLAARQDLEDVNVDPVAVQRVDFALGQAVGLLRSTLTQLHPAVLREAGLVAALHDLAEDVSRRGRVAVTVTCTDWSDGNTSADPLLLGAARELLTNVVKHAGANSAVVELTRTPGPRGVDLAHLTVSDDGRGFSTDVLAGRLRDGHLGLASRRIHVEAAGGRLTVGRSDSGGGRVAVEVPARPRPPQPPG